jgi:hypothetical protein
MSMLGVCFHNILKINEFRVKGYGDKFILETFFPFNGRAKANLY